MIFLFWVMRETIASAFLPLITESREAASVRSSRAGEKASIIPAAIRNAAPVSSADSSKAPMRSVADISLNFRANASISSHISYPRVELIESHINRCSFCAKKACVQALLTPHGLPQYRPTVRAVRQGGVCPALFLLQALLLH